MILRFFLPCFVLFLFPAAFAPAQSLTDAQIIAAIDKGLKDESGKIFVKQAGVHLYDKWMATGAAADKTGTQTAGFSVDLYTPVA